MPKLASMIAVAAVGLVSSTKSAGALQVGGDSSTRITVRQTQPNRLENMHGWHPTYLAAGVVTETRPDAGVGLAPAMVKPLAVKT